MPSLGRRLSDSFALVAAKEEKRTQGQGRKGLAVRLNDALQIRSVRWLHMQLHTHTLQGGQLRRCSCHHPVCDDRPSF